MALLPRVPTRKHALAFATAVLASGACTDEPDEPGTYIQSRVESFEYPQSPVPRLDAVIVIDDTTAMAPHRANLASLAPRIDEFLRGPVSFMPDLHVLVVTSGGVVAPLVTDEMRWDGTRTPNYAGTLASHVALLLDVGASRTGANEPLRALETALATPGFLRESTFLSATIISASDDASPMSPTAYAAIVDEAKPYYTSAIGLVAPDGAGHLDLFQSKLRYATRDSIAGVDYATSPAVLPVITYSDFGVACATLPADLDPVTPGSQFDCSLTMVIEGVDQGPLAGCPTGSLPCWDIVPDPFNCFDGTGRFITRGFPGSSHPGIRGQCVVN